MKKLKCEECGGHLAVEENGEYAKCEYCSTRYKLNEDKTVIIKLDDNQKPKLNPLTPEQQKDLDKTMTKAGMTIIVIALIIILGIGFLVFAIISGGINSTSKSSFNWDYEQHTGTQSCFFIGNMFENVITNNKKNSKHVITVVYKDYHTSNPDEIAKIKKEACPSITSFNTYDISLDYDKKGYVNTITLK